MDKMAVGVYALIIIYFAVSVGMARSAERFKNNEKYLFAMEVAVLSVSLYLNLLFSVYSKFGDASDFAYMMTELTEKGLFGLYSEGGINYPPFFQLLFWGMAWCMKAFGIPFRAELRIFVFCVKLPCVICEFLTAGLVFRLAKKYAPKGREVLALFLCLMNPGVLYTTACLCQVDMLYIFWMAATVYLLIEGRLKTSYFTFAAAVLFKFQAVFITPVIAYAVINYVFLGGFEKKRFFQHLAAGLAAIGMMMASYLPFVYDFATGDFATGGFINNFSNTTTGTSWASQNSCNFWMLVGMNDLPQTERFGFLSCQAWGWLFIVLLVVLSFLLFWKRRCDVTMYPMIAAVLVYGTWCFSVRMMDRYLYPAVFLLYLGYACRPEKRRLRCAVLVSGAYFLEIGSSQLIYPWVIYQREMVMPRAHAAVMLICFAYLVYVVWSEKKDVGSEMVSREKSVGNGAYGI